MKPLPIRPASTTRQRWARHIEQDDGRLLCPVCRMIFGLGEVNAASWHVRNRHEPGEDIDALLWRRGTTPAEGRALEEIRRERMTPEERAELESEIDYHEREANELRRRL